MRIRDSVAFVTGANRGLGLAFAQELLAAPNGHKITILLEESGLPYRIVPVNISAGDQFKPEFLKISPNNRIPGIVDDDPAEPGPPISVFDGAEAFTRDHPDAEIHLLDAGHFALESQGPEIAAIFRDFLARKLPKQVRAA
jgi:Glutathione S-transferase, N-terminal domain